MKNIGIGLLGFGTVGAGVVKGLEQNGVLIAERLGIRPVIHRIADLDLDSDRGVCVDRSLLTRDAVAVIEDPGTDVVVELIGGTGLARELVLKALDLGKPVVTANKALLAEHGREIFEKAEARGADLYFGASVGGGIPIIRALREGLVGNRILGIQGILNGTCNYILTQMENEGIPFEQALAEAQGRGYAETDPALDIDGLDTAHKAMILASLAYGSVVPMESVYVEGIRGLSQLDIRYARDLGYRIKLLAVIRAADGADDGGSGEMGVQVRVHPTLVPLNHVLASIHGVFNAVMVHGDMVGETLYYGRGAGREPTASTVIGDIGDLARNLVSDSPRRVPALVRSACRIRVMPIDEIETRHYLRLPLLDRPGVLGKITAALGSHGISIASVLQQEARAGEHVPVVIVTHRASERELVKALAEIDGMGGIVGGGTVRLRIEE